MKHEKHCVYESHTKLNLKHTCCLFVQYRQIPTNSSFNLYLLKAVSMAHMEYSFGYSTGFFRHAEIQFLIYQDQENMYLFSQQLHPSPVQVFTITNFWQPNQPCSNLRNLVYQSNSLPISSRDNQPSCLAAWPAEIMKSN